MSWKIEYKKTNLAKYIEKAQNVKFSSRFFLGRIILELHRMNDCIRVRELSIRIFREELEEEFPQFICIDLFGQRNIEFWRETFFLTDSEIGRSIRHRYDSEGIDISHLIDEFSDCYLIGVYGDGCDIFCIILDEYIDSGKKYRYNRHEIEPLSYPIEYQTQNGDHRDKIPLYGVFFMCGKYPSIHISLRKD
jgi:hypothetical protein